MLKIDGVAVPIELLAKLDDAGVEDPKLRDAAVMEYVRGHADYTPLSKDEAERVHPEALLKLRENLQKRRQEAKERREAIAKRNKELAERNAPVKPARAAAKVAPTQGVAPKSGEAK